MNLACSHLFKSFEASSTYMIKFCWIVSLTFTFPTYIGVYSSAYSKDNFLWTLNRKMSFYFLISFKTVKKFCFDHLIIQIFYFLICSSSYGLPYFKRYRGLIGIILLFCYKKIISFQKVQYHLLKLNLENCSLILFSIFQSVRALDF